MLSATMHGKSFLFFPFDEYAIAWHVGQAFFLRPEQAPRHSELRHRRDLHGVQLWFLPGSGTACFACQQGT